MSVGIKVSEKDYDVNDCSKEHIVFDSADTNLMLAKIYQAYVPGGLGSAPVFSKKHDLGYSPLVKAFYHIDDATSGAWYEQKSSDLKWDEETISGNLTYGASPIIHYILLFAFDLENTPDPALEVEYFGEYKQKDEKFGISAQEKGVKKFSTNFNRLAISNIITANYKISSTSGFDVTHGLPIIPFGEVFYKDSGGFWHHWDINIGDHYQFMSNVVTLIATWIEAMKTKIIIYGDSL